MNPVCSGNGGQPPNIPGGQPPKNRAEARSNHRLIRAQLQAKYDQERLENHRLASEILSTGTRAQELKTSIKTVQDNIRDIVHLNSVKDEEIRKLETMKRQIIDHMEMFLDGVDGDNEARAVLRFFLASEKS
ncbi:uncharacterized protein [Procambarus clarkii]|uniref:uncharacterized protein n=1 Tax=Procambarus clarkii TaxID=6728 RepID=UPI003742E17F